MVCRRGRVRVGLSPPDHRTAPPRGSAAGVHRALQHAPPPPISRSATARLSAGGHTPQPSGATIRPLRRNGLGSLLYEYVRPTRSATATWSARHAAVPTS